MENQEEPKKRGRLNFLGPFKWLIILPCLPFIIAWKILRKILNIGVGTAKETKDISRELKARERYSTIDAIFITPNGWTETKILVDSKGQNGSPLDIDKLFHLPMGKVYPHLATGKPTLFLWSKNPAALNFDKPPEDMEGVEMPIFRLSNLDKKDKHGNKLVEVVEMKKFDVQGGALLSDVAYDFVKTTYMNLLRPQAKSDIRNAFIMALILGALGGFILATLILGFLF